MIHGHDADGSFWGLLNDAREHEGNLADMDASTGVPTNGCCSGDITINMKGELADRDAMSGVSTNGCCYGDTTRKKARRLADNLFSSINMLSRNLCKWLGNTLQTTPQALLKQV